VSQFNFDIMDSAGYGYYRVWTERAYLLKLAIVPLLIKFTCMVVVMVMELDNNILRQGLVLLPADLAQGWVLSQFLRTLLMGERWPTVLPETMDERILDRLLLRARGIVAGTLSYVLIAMVGYIIRYLVFGVVMGDAPVTEEGIANALSADDNATDAANAVPLNPIYFIPLAAFIVAMFWGFRLMWVYIPFAVLMPLRDYLRALGGMMASLKMIALLLCSMAPVMFVFVMVSRFVFSLIHSLGDGGDDISQFLVIMLAVLSDTLIALVTTASFVWAMRGFLPKNPDVLKDLPKARD
jgi:hypothetical protein